MNPIDEEISEKYLNREDEIALYRRYGLNCEYFDHRPPPAVVINRKLEISLYVIAGVAGAITGWGLAQT